MEKTKNKKPSSVLILSIGIVAVTFIVGTIFIYIPFINKDKSLRNQILYERDRNLLLGNIRALGKHLEVYKKRIPESRGISSFLSEVSDIATREQIDIASIKPDVPEENNLYTKLSVILDTVSSYDQLGKFLSRIEASKDFMRIESINIKRLDSDGESDEHREKFRPFDVKSHIVISTVVLKE